MRAVLQRVTEASVTVEGEAVGSIGRGWVILLGIAPEDDEAMLARFVDKVVGLRCFEDEQGKTNLSAQDVGAELLLVSQFTLLADLSRGRRPGFSRAAPPAHAEPLVAKCADLFRARGFRVAQGQFGAEMQVSLVNDGPFTIWLDSAEFVK